MTQQRVFGQAKIVISLVVLFLLINSAFLSSISNLETNDEDTKKELELYPRINENMEYSSAKAPTGNAFFSISQDFPSLAQETLTDGQNIYTWGLNYLSMDYTATLGAHTITYDDGGSTEGSYCYNSGLIGKMDDDGNWLWAAGVDCGLFNTGLDEDGDGAEDLYYGQVFVNDASITSDGGLVVVGEAYTSENISFVSSAGSTIRNTAEVGVPFGFVGKLSAIGAWEWVEYINTDALNTGSTLGALTNCFFVPNAVDADSTGIYVGGFFGTEAGVGGPIPGSTDCADSNVGQTGDSSSDGFITKYSSLGQQGWVTNSENAAADNNVGILTIDNEGLIHVAVAFQTSVTMGSDTHQVTGQQTAAYAIGALTNSGSWDHSMKLDGGNIEESRDTDGDGVDDTTLFFGPQISGLVVSDTEEMIVHGFYGSDITLDTQYNSNGGQSDVFLGKMDTTDYTWTMGLSYGSSVLQSAENIFEVAVGPNGEIAITGIYNGTFTLGGVTLQPSNTIYYDQPTGEGYANYLALMQPDGTFSIINAMTPLDGTDSSVIAVNPFFLNNDEMPKVAGWFYGDVQFVDNGDTSTQFTSNGYEWFTWFPDLGPKDFDLDGILDQDDNCPSIANELQEDYDGDGIQGQIPTNTDDFGGDACDRDDDNDGVLDELDNCQKGVIQTPAWTSTESEDYDGDGCRDLDEDFDDDGDRICDVGGPTSYGNNNSITCIASYKSSDLCLKGDLGWISGETTQDSEGNTVSNDHDVDGCNDEGSKNNNFGEDTDDDNDGVLDPNDACPKGEINWTSSILVEPVTDLDGDGCQDSGEDLDDDNDGIDDEIDNCPTEYGESVWDRRGCVDTDKDGWSNPDDSWPAHPEGTGDAFPIDPSQWADTDQDGYGDNSTGSNADDCMLIAGDSEFDRRGCLDTDSDGFSDPDENWPTVGCTNQYGLCADALPNEPTQWTDFDGDGFGDNFGNKSWEDTRDEAWPGSYMFLAVDQDACPLVAGTSGIEGNDNVPMGCLDTDGDGWPDNMDVFPEDPTQYKDSDGDGYGDNQTGNQADGCLLAAGTSTEDRLGCPDSDGDGYSDPTSNWLPQDCGADKCADEYEDEPTQWKDTDGDGFGDNPDGVNPDACINEAEVINNFEDDDGCPDEEPILGGALGLDAASGGSLPIALGLIAALLIAVVVSVLVLRRRGDDDEFGLGYEDPTGGQMEMYVQQMMAQGYPEQTARAYAAQQFGVAAAPQQQAAPVAAPAAAAPAAAATNPRMEAYIQQLVAQGYTEEQARAYAMQYADRF